MQTHDAVDHAPFGVGFAAWDDAEGGGEVGVDEADALCGGEGGEERGVGCGGGWGREGGSGEAGEEV